MLGWDEIWVLSEKTLVGPRSSESLMTKEAEAGDVGASSSMQADAGHGRCSRPTPDRSLQIEPSLLYLIEPLSAIHRRAAAWFADKQINRVFADHSSPPKAHRA